jgi:hypothetical protein
MRGLSKWVAWGSLAGVLALSACAAAPDRLQSSRRRRGVNEDPPEVTHMALIRNALAKVSLQADQKGHR